MRSIYFIILICLLFSGSVCSQPQSDSLNTNPLYEKRKVRNLVGFIPSKAEKVNGWAIGWMTLEEKEHTVDSVIINGVYTNISPVQIMIAGFGLPYLIASPFQKNTYSMDTSLVYKVNPENKINGIALSLVDAADSYVVNGLQLTGLFHNMYKINGAAFSLGFSEYVLFNGIVIAGIVNRTGKGKGLQIGLINVANEMNGIQIGLWNKIGDSGFPLINLNFKKKNNSN